MRGEIPGETRAAAGETSGRGGGRLSSSRRVAGSGVDPEPALQGRGRTRDTVREGLVTLAAQSAYWMRSRYARLAQGIEGDRARAWTCRALVVVARRQQVRELDERRDLGPAPALARGLRPGLVAILGVQEVAAVQRGGALEVGDRLVNPARGRRGLRAGGEATRARRDRSTRPRRRSAAPAPRGAGSAKPRLPARARAPAVASFTAVLRLLGPAPRRAPARATRSAARRAAHPGGAAAGA